MLQLQAVQPGALVGSREVRGGAPGEVEEPGSEPATNLRGLGAAVEHLAGELADRLEHREPRLGRVEHPEQALVRQLADRVDEVVAGHPVGPADRLGRREVDPAPEDRQALQQPPPRLVEDVVAPRDGAAQRLLALGQIT